RILYEEPCAYLKRREYSDGADRPEALSIGSRGALRNAAASAGSAGQCALAAMLPLTRNERRAVTLSRGDRPVHRGRNDAERCCLAQATACRAGDLAPCRRAGPAVRRCAGAIRGSG